MRREREAEGEEREGVEGKVKGERKRGLWEGWRLSS
jgi:hypothetical protein